MNPQAGYREIEHTADWELEVWASDLPALLEFAARGMYALSGVRWQASESSQRTFALLASDSEKLLVAFLSELLYYQEQEGLVFDHFVLVQQGQRLHAVLSGGVLTGVDKEIKAVTYHNLNVRRTERGLEARVVFDV